MEARCSLILVLFATLEEEIHSIQIELFRKQT
jgi:hypothetical protein